MVGETLIKRWYPQSVSGSNHQEVSELGIPPGPCIVIAGNTSAGYSLMKLSLNASGILEKNGVLGFTPTRAEARQAAVKYCVGRFEELRRQQTNSGGAPMWFEPDDSPGTTLRTGASPESTSAPGSASIITETPVAPPKEQPIATPTSPGEEPPAPIVRVSPAGKPPELSWRRLPNEDEELIGTTGVCATLSFDSTDVLRTRIKFPDGTTLVLYGREGQHATDIAEGRCKVLSGR